MSAKDRDYFVVYRYEFSIGNGETGQVQGAHIFTSSATTRWELYMDHVQNRREQSARDGNPWGLNFICHTFDAKINKLS